jgi:acetyl-CoA carboxylase biotin carboxyl carrier protein
MSRHEIVTPIPGILYRRADPDGEPLKVEGDEVREGEAIALVEVMKNFQEVESDATGRLVAFLVENEDAVSAGQPIAVVETRG